jgi:hypothetical protein
MTVDFTNFDKDLVINTTPLNSDTLEYVKDYFVQDFVKSLVKNKLVCPKLVRGKLKLNKQGIKYYDEYINEVYQWLKVNIDFYKALFIANALTENLRRTSQPLIKKEMFKREYFTFQDFLDMIKCEYYTAHRDKVLSYNHTAKVLAYRYYKEIDFAILIIKTAFNQVHSYKYLHKNFFPIKIDYAVKLLHTNLENDNKILDEEGLKVAMAGNLVENL